MPRIAPLEPPYDDAVDQALAKWMPPGAGVPPLALFRTIALHPMLRERMRPLGAGFRTQSLLPLRVRELVILRTCARCAAGYEWGVHVTAFASAAGLDADAIRRTAGAASGPRHPGDDDALVLRIADELHDGANVSEPVFAAGIERFGAAGMLEIAALAGYYHLISFVVRVAGVDPEPWAERFPAQEHP